LRGHRDHGGMSDSCSESSIVNEGNFREVLRLRVRSGDTVLEDHLKNAAANATYISPHTQNQIIECCGLVIGQKILAKIKELYITVSFLTRLLIYLIDHK